MEPPISRMRRKERDAPKKAVEKIYFASFNSSLRWLGTEALPLCAFYYSHLQLRAPDLKEAHIIDQINISLILKYMHSNIDYTRPTDIEEHALSVVVFDDASRTDFAGQIGVLPGLMVD